jgi:hypothetical protein
MFRLMADNFIILLELHGKAQKEYTLQDEAFDNFNRLSANLGIDRKLVLWVYAQKHLDGIINFIRGHEMQREDVEGRIDDAIVYMQLLRGMIREERELKSLEAQIDAKTQVINENENALNEYTRQTKNYG